MIEIKDIEKDILQWANQVNEIVPVYKTRPFKTSKEFPEITGAAKAVEILTAHYANLLADDIEYFSILFMNRAGGVIGWQLISQGGISGTVADPRVIFKAAILVGATSMILCHNHPSGNIRPSSQDITLTQKIREAGRMLDIQVLDHIILAGNKFHSMAEEGSTIF